MFFFQLDIGIHNIFEFMFIYFPTFARLCTMYYYYFCIIGELVYSCVYIIPWVYYIIIYSVEAHRQWLSAKKIMVFILSILEGVRIVV